MTQATYLKQANWLLKSEEEVRRPAFTLLEVIIALSIAVSVMAMAWPRMRNAVARATLREAALQVKAGLADARDHAVRSGVVVRVTFDQNGSVFHIAEAGNERFHEEDLIDLNVTHQDPELNQEDDEALAKPSPVSHELPDLVTFEFSDPITGAPLDDFAGEQEFESKELITVDEDLAGEAMLEQSIDFFPDGRCSSATIRLGSADTNDSVTVTVRALTGGVTIGQIEHEDEEDEEVAEVEDFADMEEVAEMEPFSESQPLSETQQSYLDEQADEVWLPSFIDQAEE